MYRKKNMYPMKKFKQYSHEFHDKQSRKRVE